MADPINAFAKRVKEALERRKAEAKPLPDSVKRAMEPRELPAVVKKVTDPVGRAMHRTQEYINEATAPKESDRDRRLREVNEKLEVAKRAQEISKQGVRDQYRPGVIDEAIKRLAGDLPDGPRLREPRRYEAEPKRAFEVTRSKPVHYGENDQGYVGTDAEDRERPNKEPAVVSGPVGKAGRSYGKASGEYDKPVKPAPEPEKPGFFDERLAEFDQTADDIFGPPVAPPREPDKEPDYYWETEKTYSTPKPKKK